MGRARRAGPPTRQKTHGPGQENQLVSPKQPGPPSPLARRASPQAKMGQPEARLTYSKTTRAMQLLCFNFGALLPHTVPFHSPSTAQFLSRSKLVLPAHVSPPLSLARSTKLIHHVTFLLHRDIHHVASLRLRVFLLYPF